MRTHTNEKFQSIPARACLFAGGEIEVRSNGEGTKTAAVRLKARSGGPIYHWYWGRVVHDLAGMRLNKPRLPIDYAHNDSEVLGYLNHFDTKSGDLLASGALTPFKEGDRASEVIFKMNEGVPYEASIFFGGDGIKLQEIAEGEITQVNGRQFEGPGVVIREWPLRGVAICPYGADANTESAAMSSAAGKAFTATAWTPEEKRMSEEENAPAPVEQEAETQEAVESASVEGEVVEAVEAVEAAPVETAPEEAPSESVPQAAEASAQKPEPIPEPEPSPREEFARMVKDFGVELAAEVFIAGGDHAAARERHFARLADEVKELRAKLAADPAGAGGLPAQFAATGSKSTGGIPDLFVKGTRRQ
jgi:hypothetical protein